MHNESNFHAPGIVIGRKGSYGSVHWIASSGFAIDTAYYIDDRLTSVNLRWLYYVLQAVDLRGPSQDVGVPGLSREAAYNVLVPSPPPLEEQGRIVDFLDAETSRIDGLVTLRHRQVNLLAERNSALRDSLIDKLFATEGEVPLRRVVLGIEQGESPQCDAVPREMGEWGVLKLSAVKQGVFNPSENKRLPDDVSPTKGYEVQPGDLLVTRANTPSLVGDAAVVCEGSSWLLLPDLIYRVRLTGQMSAKFLMHVALSGRTRSLVESVARGSSQSMVKLRGEDIKSWPIPRASHAQQAELVQEIQRGTTGTQKLRQVIDQQIALLTERRQSLITAAVTGQFDVTTASGRHVTEGVTV
jgi:type I restriction enzyme S subunit